MEAGGLDGKERSRLDQTASVASGTILAPELMHRLREGSQCPDPCPSRPMPAPVRLLQLVTGLLGSSPWPPTPSNTAGSGSACDSQGQGRAGRAGPHGPAGTGPRGCARPLAMAGGRAADRFRVAGKRAVHRPLLEGKSLFVQEIKGQMGDGTLRGSKRGHAHWPARYGDKLGANRRSGDRQGRGHPRASQPGPRRAAAPQRPLRGCLQSARPAPCP